MIFAYYAAYAFMALVDGLERWLSENAFASVKDIRVRLDATHVDRADMFLRTQYLRTLSDYELHEAPVGLGERATLPQSSSKRASEGERR